MPFDLIKFITANFTGKFVYLVNGSRNETIINKFYIQVAALSTKLEPHNSIIVIV